MEIYPTDLLQCKCVATQKHHKPTKKEKVFMKAKILLLILIYSVSTYASIDLSDLVNPSVLKDITQVQSILTSRGFKKIYFTAEDNITLCGLFLDQSSTKKIKGTILYCAGFYPGSKEGMASFYSLIADEPYNFLFFDARYHNESGNNLFSYNNLKNYGRSEYKDIVAAINFLEEYNTTHHISPSIIIHGICAGAFHAVKAVDHLTINRNNAQDHIKAIIFDSGWFRLTDIVEPTIYSEIKNKLKKSYFSWLTKPINFIVQSFYRLALKHHYDKIDSVENSIQRIKCPIFFLHCAGDPYVSIQPVQLLVNRLKLPHSWWIDHDSHASYHMRHQKEYKEKIECFLSKIK